MYLYLYSGACEESKLPLDGLEHRKPKQMKLPSQAHVDPLLWREGPRESPVEPEGWADRSWGSPALGATWGTPTGSLSRSPQRKKTEAVLFGCTALLASVALGLDIRELSRAPAADELSPREDRKKCEGIFLRAAKSHSSTSPATGATLGDGPRSPTMFPLGAPSPLNALSLSAKGGLPSCLGNYLEGSAHFTCDPKKPAAGGGSRGEPSSRPAPGIDWRAAKAPSPLQMGQPCCACSAGRAMLRRPTMVEGSALRTSRCLPWVRTQSPTMQVRMQNCVASGFYLFPVINCLFTQIFGFYPTLLWDLTFGFWEM